MVLRLKMNSDGKFLSVVAFGSKNVCSFVWPGFMYLIVFDICKETRKSLHLKINIRAEAKLSLRFSSARFPATNARLISVHCLYNEREIMLY